VYDNTDFSATVGTTDQVILGSMQGRKSFTLSPPSVGRVSIQFGRAAVLDQGITLQAGTTPRQFSVDEFGYDVRGDIHAIADAAGRIVGGVVIFKAWP
jgi:hypothetical protein